MLIARIFAVAALGAGLFVLIHRLSSGGNEHYGEKIVAGVLIGFFVGVLDEVRKLRRTVG